jgi:hypothetical protein
VCIRGEDIVIVRAAANTWLRLLKIAEEMIAAVGEYGKDKEKGNIIIPVINCK